MSLFLSDDEIQALTGKKRKSAQCRALSMLGVEHKIRADGVPVVLRAHLEKVMGGAETPATKPKKKASPNWSALDVTAQTPP